MFCAQITIPRCLSAQITIPRCLSAQITIQITIHTAIPRCLSAQRYSRSAVVYVFFFGWVWIWHGMAWSGMVQVCMVG